MSEYRLDAPSLRLRRLLPLLLGALAAQLALPAQAKTVAPTPPAAAVPQKLLPCRPQAAHLPSGILVLRDCEGAPEMIELHGGSYLMGGQLGDGEVYEQPHHVVQIHPVAIGRFEVTNAEWNLCVQAGGCLPAHLAADAAHGRYPVAGVTWTQAKAFVDWLAARTGKPYRLPSESEWEYAARSGENSSSPWSTAGIDPCSRANMLDASGRRQHPDWTWAEKCEDHFAGAAPVGSFPPNAWGFHDMLGNVWEWVADCWHNDYTGAPTDGSAWKTGACSKYVNRGGGWGNNLAMLRYSSRDADPKDSYAEGLGFRVARSIGGDELPADLAAMPDTRPLPSETTLAADAASGSSGARRTGSAAAANPPSAAGLPPPATSLATERQFDLHLSFKGEQTWKYYLQHTQGSTKQDYVLSTRLRSDGVLYGENLLDLDPATRLAVKTQYLARRGLIRLKAMNGGRLPRTAEEVSALTAKVQAGMVNCMTEQDCSDGAVELSAGLGALQNNRIEDLDALIAAPATGLAARWLYFFGYADCPNSLHVTGETHIVGERAYNHTKTSSGLPWALDSSANTAGSAEVRANLCRRYTATVDIRSGDVYLENLYMPAVPGTTVRSFHGRVERSDEGPLVPTEVRSWSSAKLRRTRETANFSEVLTANAPFDEDYTFLGDYDGKLETTMTWSFLPVAGASLAVVPPQAPVR